MPEVYSSLLSNPNLENSILESKQSNSNRETEVLRDISVSLDKNETLYQFVVSLKMQKTVMTLDFLFNNFRFIANERTIEKLVKFLFQIMMSLDKKDNQLERLKEEYLKYTTGNDNSGVGPLKADFEITDSAQETSIFDSLRKAREEYLIKEKGIEIIILEKLEEKRQLKVNGTINDIEVWVPLDWNKKDSKLMSFEFSSKVKYESLNHKNYYINNLTNLIFKVDNISHTDQARISLDNLNIRVESFKIDEIKELAYEDNLIILPQENYIRTHLLK